MRKLFFLFLALVATTSLWAQRFQVGDLYYIITSNSAPYTVEVTDAVSSIATAIIPENVTYDGTTYSVTSIGWNAFAGCSSLTSVTIGNSVTSIGHGAFYECYSLTSITIPNSVTSIGSWAFMYCSSLTSITIPNSVTDIGEETFSSCRSLATITIGNSVTFIGDEAFYECYSLTSVTIPNSVTHIGERAFYYCSSLTSVTIPNSVTFIGDEAFYKCYSLTSVTLNSNDIVSKKYTYEKGISDIFGSQVEKYILGNSVTSIGDYAFSDCSALTSFTIPNSVTSIGYRAFYDCSSLTSITIPNSVTSIGSSAFYGCSSLTSITIPNSVTSIAYWTFRGCSSLTSVTIPNSVTSIGDGAFEDCSSLTKTNYTGDIAGWCNIMFGDGYANPIYYSHNFYINDQEIKDLVIPNSVTSIGSGVFNNCSSLTSITIPESVTSIPVEAFAGCSSLTSITIPNSVTSIGYRAFDGCTGLNLLRVGTGIQSIAANAFANCTKLYDIYCLAAEPPTGYTSSFANYNAFIHVPCESQRLYMLDVLFGEFKYIECIASDEVPTDDIVITPGSTDVTITWPTEEGADTYTIVIKKDGEVVCTLTFNAEGQLLNIAFAPGRDGNHPAQYAEQAANGYRFTVTGLEEATDYTYDITVKDASNKTINSHSGKFTTESLTAVDNITTNNTNIQKLLRNGQLIIVRDGVEYNAMGQEL